MLNGPVSQAASQFGEATGEGDRSEDEDASTSGSDLDWEATEDEGSGTSGSRAAKLFLVCVSSGLNISMKTPVARGRLLRLPWQVTYLHGWLVGSRTAPYSKEEETTSGMEPCLAPASRLWRADTAAKHPPDQSGVRLLEWKKN
jgi:hypothetical protein